MAMPARHFITPLAIVASRVRTPSSQPLLPVIGLMVLSRTIVHRQRFQATQRRRGGGGGDNNGGCSSDAPGAIQGPVPTNFPTLTFGSGTSLLPAGEEGGVGHGGTMRTLKASDAEDFYFKGQQSLVTEDVSPAQMHHHYHNNNGRPPPSGQQQTYFCRLCQEDVVPPFTPRAHILASSRTTHTNHSCRETVLDTLAVVLARGYSIDKMALTWARLLFHHPRDAFPRIGALSDPTWSLAKRGEKLLELLKLLTDVGVIDIAYAAIAPEDPAQQSAAHRRRIAMERTECIGDNSWGHHMSHRMITLFPDRQFLFSQFAYSYNCFRDACEMNVTLEWIYDVLQISLLFPPTHRERIGNGKMKADILEAILGELHLNLFGFMPQIYDNQQYVEVNGEGERLLSSIIEHVMTEIFDMIILHFVGELTTTAVPLAKEIAAPMLWRTARTQLSKQKDRTGSLRRRNQSLQTSRIVQLPALLAVSPEMTVRPTSAPHPLRRQGFQLPETTVYNGQDALQDMIPHLLAVDSSEDFRATGVIETVKADLVGWTRFREALQLGLADDSPLLGVDDDELYFRDPYFNLTTTPSYNNAVVSSAAVGAATIAPTEGSGAEGGGGSDSSIHGDRPLAAAAAAWSIVGVFPRLQDGPTIVHDPTSSTLGGSTQTSSCFDASRLVPSTVKPPVAGVVTEKNLYPGRFLFTALMQHSAAAKAKKNVPIQETAATEGDTSAAASPVDKIVNDVVTDPGHTSDTTAAAVVAPTASSPTEPASGVDSGSSNNAASINDGISLTETILEQLVQQWQQRCSTESDCFPVLMTGLRLHVTPPQQSSQSNVYSEE